jgi:Protein of unknown function (DUF2934)
MKTPTEEQIRRRAYEIYMKYGEPGRDAQNWSEAERELQQVQEPAETEATDWEQKATRRDGNGKRAVTVSSGRNQEFQKGF